MVETGAPQVNALSALAKTCLELAEKARTERIAMQETMESFRDSLQPTMQGAIAAIDFRSKVERLHGKEDAYRAVASGIETGLLAGTKLDKGEGFE